MIKRVNYLNNKDLLIEIHKSKNSFSSFAKPEYNEFDSIVDDLSEITDEIISEAKQTKLKKLAIQWLESEKELGNSPKLADFPTTIDDIKTDDIIFRVMTFDHIPDLAGKKESKLIKEMKEKLNFPPFQHWKFENGSLILVGKSHWKGDLETGKFSKNHGKLTEKLGDMIIKLSKRYSTRGNLRAYTYVDELQGEAIIHLCAAGLKFDEKKSKNPFAYFTQLIKCAMIKVLNAEKRAQDIRDDILELNDMNPSNTRLINSEFEADMKREALYNAGFVFTED